MRIAIIGAGLAGAACATGLKKAGHDVVLFDKGRGAGGRLSTRRVDTELGELRFDHGAQFVTTSSDGFQALIDDAMEHKCVEPWQARLISLDRYGNADPLHPRERYVGVHGMSALAKHALKDLNKHFSRRATKIKGEAGRWSVHFEDGASEGPFDKLAVSLPPEQLIDFLARSDGDFSDIIKTAHAGLVRPCWTVMAALRAPFDPGFDGAKIYGGAIRWMGRMATKPGHSDVEAVVIQASPDWSEQFLESPPDTITRMLCEEAYVRFGLPEPVWSDAHRWRYAMVETAAETAFATSENDSVGIIGDWRLGGKAEAAWLSGEALASSWTR